MAPTVGNLSVDDDLMHAVGEDPSHNESMFFNFFDPKEEIGGFVRIGNRPNEGRAEMTFCLFLGDGSLLFQWAKDPLSDPSKFDTAGMTFEVFKPGGDIAVGFHRPAVHLTDPLQMKDPGSAMRGNPLVDVDLDLELRGSGPMIGDRTGSTDGSVIYMEGCGHYQQPLAAVGTLSALGRKWNLDMVGVRDHSWGPRVWSSLYKDRSIWISFGDDLSFIACKTWRSPDGAPEEMGCVIESGEVTSLSKIRVRSRYQPETWYHSGLVLDVTDVRGRDFSLNGEVLAYVPLRHRTPGKDTVYLGQGMTRFTLAGRSTIGLAEYFDAAGPAKDIVEQSRSGQSIPE